MAELAPESDPRLREAEAFARLAVSQGLAEPAVVWSCFARLRELAAGGAASLPTLAELLLREGVLRVPVVDPTVVTPVPAATAKAPATDPDDGLPPEAALAARQESLRLGKFILVSPLGSGGAGEVHRAFQRDLRRWVAIKILKAGSGLDGDRLKQEASLAAQLSHPNIVTVYEGDSVDGRAYLSMEYVRGRSLDRVRLPLPDVIRAMRTVAEAIEAAHRQGIIHRDLKPANLLMGEDGRVRVTDFGLAQALDHVPGSGAPGGISGTPAFMPPEQAQGRSCGARSDVYSLGATLYALLADRPPFEGPKDAVLPRVISEDPAPLCRVNPAVPVDVGAIVHKAMEKDPGRRYPSAATFADDLRAWMDGEPVKARPVGRLRRALKWMKRHPAVTTIGGILLAVLIGGSTGTAIYLRDLELARAAEAAEAVRARAAEGRTEKALRSAEMQLAESRIAEGDAFAGGGRWKEARRRHEEAYALVLRLGISPRAAELALQEGYRSAPLPLLSFPGHRGPVRGVALSPDGRRLRSIGQDRTIRIWDAETGRELQRLDGTDREVRGGAVSADGATAVLLSGDRRMEVWHLDPVAPSAGIDLPLFQALSLSINSAGRRALVLDKDRALRVWDLDSGTLAKTIPEATENPFSTTLSPDGTRAAISGKNHSIYVLDLEAGKPRLILRGHANWVNSLQFTPDGRRLLSGSEDLTVKLWDLDSGEELRTFAGHDNQIDALAVSADSRRMVSGSQDGTVRVWDLDTGRMLFALVDFVGPVTAVHCSGDGRRVVAGAKDGSLRLWDLAPDQEVRPFRGYTRHAFALAASADGRLLAAGGENRTVQIWDTATGEPVRLLSGHFEFVTALAFAGEGYRLVSAGRDHLLKVWEPGQDNPVRVLAGHFNPVVALAVSRDGSRAASAAESGPIRIWDLGSGAFRLVPGTGSSICLAFTPDGRKVLAGRPNGSLLVCDADEGRMIRTHAVDQGPLYAVAPLPDGRHVLAAGHEGRLRVVEIESGAVVCEGEQRSHWIRGVAGSPDGKTAVTGCRDFSFRAWDLESGKALRRWTLHAGEIKAVAYSPEGSRAFSAGDLGEVLAWEFGRPAEYRRFRELLEGLPRGSQAPSSETLAQLGEWHAFRGAWDAAISCFEQSRQSGGKVSALALGRCHWRTGAREKAHAELERALAAGEAPEPYLRICLRALAAPRVDQSQLLADWGRKTGSYASVAKLMEVFPPAAWTPERIQELRERATQGQALSEEELRFLEHYAQWDWARRKSGSAPKTPPKPGDP